MGKNAEEITAYLQSIGKEKFGDAMALQMERLPGKLSNLRDTVQNLWRTLGDAGVTDALGDIVSGVAGKIEGLRELISTGFAAERISILLDAWTAPFTEAFATIAKQWSTMSEGMGIDWGHAFGFIPVFFGDLVDWVALIPRAWQAAITSMLEIGGAMFANWGDEWAAYSTTAEIAWENVGYAANVAWDYIKLGFAKMKDWVIGGFADMLHSLASMAEALPFGDGMAASINTAAIALDTMASSEGNVRAEMAASKVVHEDLVGSMEAGRQVVIDIMNTRMEAALGNSAAAWEEVAAEKELMDARQADAEALLTAVKAGESYEAILDRLAKGGKKAAEGTADMTKKMKELDRLKAIIDPGQKAIQKLRKEMLALKELTKGDDPLVDPVQFEKMAEGLERAILGTETLAEGFERAAGLAAGALRDIQSSLTDGSKAYEAMNVAIQIANVSKAIGAVLTQGSGDPYTAFARMAAMAGAVAALGVSIGSFQGGFTDTAAERQKTQGTGTVLGDAEAKSKSIQRATETTASATEQLVGINRNMLKALNRLGAGMAGASTNIAKQGLGDFSAMPNTDLSSFNSGAWVPIIGGIASRIANAIFGGKSKITDEGIAILAGSLNQAIDGTLVAAFQEVQYKKWVFGKKKTREEMLDMASDAQAQIGLVFEALGDAVRQGAIALGIDAGLIEERLAAFRIQEQRISLKDLTAEEQAKEIEAVFSKIFDELAAAVVPFIDQFQQVGEGLGETLVRVATSVQVMQEAIKQMGWAVDQADPESFAQVAVGLIEMAGGIDSFIGKMQSFVSAFATDEHNFKIASNALNSAFSQVGLALPETAAGLWELMQSLDATTEEGQRQITTLLNLTDHAKTYYDQLGDIEDKKMSAIREQLDLVYQLDDISQAVSDRFKALQTTIDDQINPKSIDDSTAILDALMLQLAGAGSADEVNRVSAEIERVARAAWGVLPEEMRKTMGPQFIEMLGEADRVAQERLGLFRQDLVNAAQRMADEAALTRASQEAMAREIAAAIASIPDRIVVVAPAAAPSEFV